MLRTTMQWSLKHRPKTQKVDVGSNRFLDEPHFTKAKEIFAVPEFPNKQVIHNWRFFIRAGKAATGPPVGQEFSKLGLKVMDFTKAFNDRTKPVFKDDVDLLVRIQVFFDKAYNYRIEPPPTTWLILKALRLKRRDTGPVPIAGAYTSLITLEMIYEIAKIKQFRWESPESPPIEVRVRRIAGQCRGMGIAIIGVDCPSSPVKGITTAQYEAQSEKYRAEQMVQYEKLMQDQLENAPLVERLHNPNLSALSYEQVREGLLDPKLFSAIWKASHPPSAYSSNAAETAHKSMINRNVLSDMSLQECRALLFNWKLPAIERKRQLEGDQDQSYWSRDGPQ